MMLGKYHMVFGFELQTHDSLFQDGGNVHCVRPAWLFLESMINNPVLGISMTWLKMFCVMPFEE